MKNVDQSQSTPKSTPIGRLETRVAIISGILLSLSVVLADPTTNSISFLVRYFVLQQSGQDMVAEKTPEELVALMAEREVIVSRAAVGKLLRDREIEAILMAMKHPNRQVRKLAVLWIIAFEFDPRILPAVREALGDSDKRVRSGAVRAIAEIGDSTDLIRLEELMGDRSAMVRSAAGESLDLLRNSLPR